MKETVDQEGKGSPAQGTYLEESVSETISLKGLTKYYGRMRGIEGVDLTVDRGEFFGFIGPNGAGKSTTIRLLLGLVKPTGGEARIFGMDVEKDREKILSAVGYLPAEASFYPGMRVKDVLELSAGLRENSDRLNSDRLKNDRLKIAKSCRETAGELCGRLHLDPSRKVEELSFGNRKKTAIVCALQHEPELLFFDEPTSGLDPLMQKEFFEILRERNQAGTTIFLSSHILSEVQHNCSRAAIIREGRIIACDRVEALYRTGMKRVGIRGRVDLSGLSGVQDLQKMGAETLNFLYAGEMKSLLAALAKGEIHDLTMTEPDLEEMFLHDFQEGNT